LYTSSGEVRSAHYNALLPVDEKEGIVRDIFEEFILIS
jgi:hypothetical protein